MAILLMSLIMPSASSAVGWLAMPEKKESFLAESHGNKSPSIEQKLPASD